MRPLCLATLIYGGTLLLQQGVSPALPQGGQGASAFASDAQTFLRSGPLTRVPGEQAEILQSLPPGFPLALIPEGGVPAVASVSSSLTIVVVVVKADRPFTAADYRSKLSQAGWMTNTPAGGGFLPSVAGQSMCRADEFISLLFRDTPSRDHLVRISFSKESGRPCSAISVRMLSDVDMPTLTLPPGARRLSTSGSFGTDDASSRTRIETTLTLTELVTFFLPQFVQAGWKVEAGPIGDSTMSMTRLIGATRAGEPVTAQLIITALPGGTSVDLMARFLRTK